jgi:hypothetical protein
MPNPVQIALNISSEIQTAIADVNGRKHLEFIEKSLATAQRDLNNSMQSHQQHIREFDIQLQAVGEKRQTDKT